ncbi:MAG: beta-phosphoglucomutase, partial [Phycisphaerales bacterium]|nr:beta-phosphoglucomutase [Phycisphaerales bacterium]
AFRGAPPPPPRERFTLQAVLFDLDGVLVDTAKFHFLAWKQLADELGAEFDERINDQFRGVGRMACLDMLLGEHERFFALEEKRLLAERKNSYYLELVKTLGPQDLAKGAATLADDLRAIGVRLALVSASCNARLVLKLLGITHWFDAIVDGSECGEKRDGFLRAAKKMQLSVQQCIVVEDAEAGVLAAKAAGMKCVGIGPSAVGADISVQQLDQLRFHEPDRFFLRDLREVAIGAGDVRFG